MQTTAVSFSITLYLVKMGWLGIKENKWKKKQGDIKTLTGLD